MPWRSQNARTAKRLLVRIDDTAGGVVGVLEGDDPRDGVVGVFVGAHVELQLLRVEGAVG